MHTTGGRGKNLQNTLLHQIFTPCSGLLISFNLGAKRVNKKVYSGPNSEVSTHARSQLEWLIFV